MHVSNGKLCLNCLNSNSINQRFLYMIAICAAGKIKLLVT
jgi:hypothetical protein